MLPDDFAQASSIRFALEGALLSSVRGPIWHNGFTRGEDAIPLHCLIWMESPEGMRTQIQKGIQAGFHCLKMKISAATWQSDLQLLAEARELEPLIELRVDANGDFAPDEALDRLQELAPIGISCVEQPIAVGQWDAMSSIIAQSPIRIGLDEELIDCHSFEQRSLMLSVLKPHALIIKPSLHGGLQAAEEYLHLTQGKKCTCWLNSSLESNIGLDILSQWVGEYMPERTQALGTGQLYKENFTVPTQFVTNQLRYI